MAEPRRCDPDGLLTTPLDPTLVRDVVVAFTAREHRWLTARAAAAGISVEQLVYDAVMAPARR
jgi:hypothetical protein